MFFSSTVSPDQESARITSSWVIMPRSPWAASLGCTKKAGVPVEANVAATFWPMWPLLPMPETMTRPRAAMQQLHGTRERLGKAVLQGALERGQPVRLELERAQRRRDGKQAARSTGPPPIAPSLRVAAAGCVIPRHPPACRQPVVAGKRAAALGPL